MDLHITDPDLAVLAALIGCGGIDAYREMLPKVLENGITPVTVKEIVYQAADYLGYGRMLPFLNCTNEVFSEKRIALPLEGQAATTFENRLEKGIEVQAEIFGEHMKEQPPARSKLLWRLLHSKGTFPLRA